jgi:2-(1,2-epoxy-1,2-dihydrophenyl)acetyl-CoA isomerase
MFRKAILLREFEKPVIAAVNGPAVGAGANLALACDIRIASEKAKFGQVFVKRGVTPDWGGTYSLPRLVGPAKACELIFTGKIIDAQEAFQIGMVNMVVPVDKFEKTWKEFALDIAENSAPLALKISKEAIYKSYEASFAAMIEFETFSSFFTSGTKDHQEGVKSFLKKRPPAFSGE